MRRLPGFGEKGISINGVAGGWGRGLGGLTFVPGLSPSNRIHATNFFSIIALSDIMLQCSKFKVYGCPRLKKAFAEAFSCIFYQKLNPGAASQRSWRCVQMDLLASASDLRHLLSVASKLRELANNSLCRGDQALYLMTAEALERRALWLATTLPQEKNEDRRDPSLHKSVDVTI